MVESPVDFAIISALKVEREAMVRRLAEVRKIQDEDEPLTYYVGKLAVPGEDRPYTVVVAQLIEMGNPDAAITTTKVIPRWRPRNVLMVGIAGGVKGKVALGDVVVSQYAHYYEPSKRKPKIVEHRDRQFNSDLMLFARAQQYDAAEWKSEIDSPRPGTGKSKLPDVSFGPIACGEEVIADDRSLAALQRQCPKMVAVAMEGAGVAKAVLSAGNPPRYLEIRGVSDYAGPKKNDGWHEYAANAAAAFTIGFLRSRPFPPGPPPEQAAGKTKAAPTLVMIAQSLRAISADELMPVLDEGAKRGELEFLHLDFTDLVKNKAFANPQAAAERVASPQGKLLAELARRADARLVFGGLAAIPPVVLAGHVVTARRSVRLFDFHERDWAWPGTPDGFPELRRSALPKRPIKDQGEAVIRLAVSYPVTKADNRITGGACTRTSLPLIVADREGRDAVARLVRRAKAERVGTAIGDLTVCGAVPPYNELLAGKLVSLLMVGPQVVTEYRRRYGKSPSVIASSMAGREIVRPAELVYVGTTSLYGQRPSQYDRITFEFGSRGDTPASALRYRYLGKTKGIGTFQFGEDTVSELATLLAQSKKGQRVNSVFGEGVNPRLRKIRDGLALLGLDSDEFLDHGAPRLVYGVELARNTGEYLLGITTDPDFLFPAKTRDMTAEMVSWWLSRWVLGRLSREEVITRIAEQRLTHPIRHAARVARVSENTPSLFDE